MDGLLGRFHCTLFQPGDWMFINLPVISKFEWHPFTISSAPERGDVLTFHIRSVGGWTNKLHEYFVEENRLIEDERSGRVTKERKRMIPRYKVHCSKFLGRPKQLRLGRPRKVEQWTYC